MCCFWGIMWNLSWKVSHIIILTMAVVSHWPKSHFSRLITFMWYRVRQKSISGAIWNTSLQTLIILKLQPWQGNAWIPPLNSSGTSVCEYDKNTHLEWILTAICLFQLNYINGGAHSADWMGHIVLCGFVLHTILSSSYTGSLLGPNLRGDDCWGQSKNNILTCVRTNMRT